MATGVRGGRPDEEAPPEPRAGGMHRRVVSRARGRGGNRRGAQLAQPRGQGRTGVSHGGQKGGRAGVGERWELTSFLAVTETAARLTPKRVPTAADEVLRRKTPEAEIFSFDWRKEEASRAGWAAVVRRGGEQSVLIGASGCWHRAQTAGGGDGPVRGGSLRRDRGAPMLFDRRVG
jgi:hypothetical protein